MYSVVSDTHIDNCDICLVRTDMNTKIFQFNASTSTEERSALASEIRVFHGWLNSGYDGKICPELSEAIIQA